MKKSRTEVKGMSREGETRFWIDLQWHSDVEGGEAQPSIGFTSYEEDIEILSPEEVEARQQGSGEKSREELLAELEELRAQGQGQGSNPEVEGLKTELAEARRGQQGGLSIEQLQAFAQLQGQQRQTPKESDAEFKERIKEHILDDPVGILDEYLAKKLTPEIQRLATNNMYQSKRFLELDPDKGETYRKYRADIDKVVEQMPAQDRLYDPHVYEKAYQQVMTLHIDDIIAAKVQEALAGQEGASGAKKNPLTGAARTHSEMGGTPSPAGAGSKKSVVISKAEEQSAALRGISKQVLAQWKVRHPGVEFK